jgi:hypothetical protein
MHALITLIFEEFTKHTDHHGQDGNTFDTFAARRDALVGCCSGPEGTPMS